MSSCPPKTAKKPFQLWLMLISVTIRLTANKRDDDIERRGWNRWWGGIATGKWGGGVDWERRPGTWFLARWTGSLSHARLGKDGMLRWLFKQVNWAGLPRDRDRWMDRMRAQRWREQKSNGGRAVRLGNRKRRAGWRDGWWETSMATDHRHRGEHAV